MFLIRDPVRWLANIVVHFPEAVRPGLFVALVVLIWWFLLRRARPAWRLCVRSACAMIDLSIGFALLAEYGWTRHRRSHGMPAASVAVTGGQVAERVLDRAADIYEKIPPVKSIGRWRTPVIWGVIFCAVSIVLYRVGLHAPPNAPSKLAAHVFRYWATLNGWAHRS
jgi:hypothetical protein